MFTIKPQTLQYWYKNFLSDYLPDIQNDKAERLNGKVQHFISNNYGIKDKDFILYRIAKYLS